MIWNNVITTHHRLMANFLRRRGWVCFYLEEPYRKCGYSHVPYGCWLDLYLQDEQRRDTAADPPAPPQAPTR